MTNDKNASSKWKKQNCKNTLHLFYWTAAWLVSTAFAVFAPKYLWEFETSLTIIAVLINIAVGFAMLGANKRHLNGLDEMMQKIQLEAMALTLGVGLVVGLAYETLEDVKLIASEPEISHLIMLMAFTYMVGIILGNRRYR